MTRDALRTRLRTRADLRTCDGLRTCVNVFNDSATHNVYHTALDSETTPKQRVAICPVRMQMSQYIGLMTNL